MLCCSDVCGVSVELERIDQEVTVEVERFGLSLCCAVVTSALFQWSWSGLTRR